MKVRSELDPYVISVKYSARVVTKIILNKKFLLFYLNDYNKIFRKSNSFSSKNSTIDVLYFDCVYTLKVFFQKLKIINFPKIGSFYFNFISPSSLAKEIPEPD